MDVLGVRIDEYDEKEAVRRALSFLSGTDARMICTPNPEILVAAHQDPEFKKILNQADLSLCDGRGVEMVGRGRLTRVTGVDFMLELCRRAQDRSSSIFLLGSEDARVLDAVERELLNKFPRLSIVGSHPGPRISIKQSSDRSITFDNEENGQLIDELNRTSPSILFVAFGHTKQEKWIYKHMSAIPSVRIVMGVGGAFDFIAGKTMRAPRVIRRMGCEWLWRFFHQPRRARRIWNALVVFPWYVVRYNSRI
jgi:N-acetylglucosaminyldiphosphoundecaprenol N-acetyl-beta-D-mannosaminyltransferase